MTPKITLSSKWHYGISKPELRAKKTHHYDCRDCIHSKLLFCGGHFGNMQISWLNMQNLEWYLADLKSTRKNTIETVEKSLTDMFIRLVRIYPCLINVCPTIMGGIKIYNDDQLVEWEWMQWMTYTIFWYISCSSSLVHLHSISRRYADENEFVPGSRRKAILMVKLM